MPKNPHNTAKLPKKLLDELGIDGQYSRTQGRLRGPGVRRERRKTIRIQKKKRHASLTKKAHQIRFRETRSQIEDEMISVSDGSSGVDATQPFTESKTVPKSILKASKSGATVQPAQSLQGSNTPLQKPRLSRGVKDRLAEDDAKIASLEKALRMGGKRQLPKAFKEDGLDSLLVGLDEYQSLDKPPSTQKNWTELSGELDPKRKNSSGSQAKITEMQGRGRKCLSSNDLGADEAYDSDESGKSLCEEDASSQGSFEGFDVDPPPVAILASRKVRENPYAPPLIPQSSQVSATYTPPSTRVSNASEEETVRLLQRQIQGLLNRLSKANLIAILNDFERLYRDHPRQHVSSTLQDLLLSLICDPASLQDTFVVLHAGFIAGCYKLIGSDFGAQFVQSAVERFDDAYFSTGERERNGKQLTNLISLLGELYNFQVIGSDLIFDFVQMFIKDLSEHSTELLLKVIQNSGQQLRQDSPGRLGENIQLLHSRIGLLGIDNLSVRTKYMIETIHSLKNNRMKSGATTSGITSDHRRGMKEMLGPLNARNVRASESLGIRLAELRDARKRGKWWLTGASYRDENRSGNAHPVSHLITDSPPPHNRAGGMDIEFTDLAQLAREHRMNTDIRRSIFVTLMSATDYRDAHLRLSKLQLTRRQEYNVPRVLIYCSNIEKVYNPYYTLVARKLCRDKKHKKAFQFLLLDEFRRMGENAEDEEDGDVLEIHEVVNMAKLYGRLVAEGRLDLNVIKTLNLAYLQPKTHIFVELFLITIIVDSQLRSTNRRDEKQLMKVFSLLTNTPELIEGVSHFMKEVVSNTDVAGSEKSRELVKWGCGVACSTLSKITATKMSSQ